MIHFTADLHFGHRKIIEYCGRPFASIEEHDQTLTDNWNAVVRPNDEVYILGDFIFAGRREDVAERAGRLKGKKYLILGNHDRPELCEGCFEWLKPYFIVHAHNLKWILFHYPILEWEGWYRPGRVVHLYGHVHNHAENPAAPPHLRFLAEQKNCFNVGVDLNGFAPVSIKTLTSRLKLQAAETSVNGR